MCLVTQSCPTPCDLMDHSLPGSSVHGIFPGKNTGAGCHFLKHHKRKFLSGQHHHPPSKVGEDKGNPGRGCHQSLQVMRDPQGQEAKHKKSSAVTWVVLDPWWQLFPPSPVRTGQRLARCSPNPFPLLLEDTVLIFSTLPCISEQSCD